MPGSGRAFLTMLLSLPRAYRDLKAAYDELKSRFELLDKSHQLISADYLALNDKYMRMLNVKRSASAEYEGKYHTTLAQLKQANSKLEELARSNEKFIRRYRVAEKELSDLKQTVGQGATSGN